jgi:hypothetical protein
VLRDLSVFIPEFPHTGEFETTNLVDLSPFYLSMSSPSDFFFFFFEFTIESNPIEIHSKKKIPEVRYQILKPLSYFATPWKLAGSQPISPDAPRDPPRCFPLAAHASDVCISCRRDAASGCRSTLDTH